MAVSVTAEIKRLLKAKDQKLLDGMTAMRGLLDEVKRQIVEELQAVSGDSYAAYHLRQNLASIERHLQNFESAAGRQIVNLLDDAWDTGADLPLTATRAGGLTSTSFGMLPTSVLQSIKDFSIYKISGLTADAFGKIRGELTLGILGQQTPHQVMQAIAGTLESPGVFRSIAERAEVITGTEMGRAFSQATQLGMEQAAVSLPELKKQWWHAGHPKQPRQNHLALHGQIQPVDRPFVLGSLVIRFPRDPKAPASEVIRCGCDHVPWMESWDRDNKLPIYNERGEEIARRGPRTGLEEPLTGKFAVGQIKRPGAGKDTKKP
jgi:hypothetical protein